MKKRRLIKHRRPAMADIIDMTKLHEAQAAADDRTASRRALQSRRGYGHRRARYEGPHVACDRSGARGVRFWMARVLFRRLSDEQATQERRADAGSHDAASVRPKALRSWLTKSLNSTAALGRLQQTMDRLRRLRQGLPRQVRTGWPGEHRRQAVPLYWRADQRHEPPHWSAAL